MESLMSFAIYSICLVCATYMSWKYGLEQGASSTLELLAEKGIIEFVDEDEEEEEE